jgi:S1-C subfamily serine protease
MHWFDSSRRFSWTADPAIQSGAGGLQGTGLATSCDLAKHVIDPLLHGGSVQGGYLGVRVQPLISGVDHQAIKSVPESRKALAKGPSEKGRLLQVRTAQGGTEYVPLK